MGPGNPELQAVDSSPPRIASLGATDQEAWWAAAIVLTMPAVYAGSHGCFVDGIFAVFVLAGFRIGIDAQILKEWIACGLFCGFAIGTKYTGLIAVPILLACIVLLRWRDLELESAATKAMAAIAVKRVTFEEPQGEILPTE